MHSKTLVFDSFCESSKIVLQILRFLKDVVIVKFALTGAINSPSRFVFASFELITAMET